MGESYIRLNKVSDKLFKVEVMYFKPAAQEYVNAFKATYKWVKRFKTLVATDCYHDPPKEEPPLVEYKCETATRVATNLIKVAVAGKIVDIDKSGYTKMAECVKQKTIE